MSTTEYDLLLEKERRKRLKARMEEGLKMSLSDYFETTVNFKLDPWQRHLCGVLESTATTTGRRILIHAMPQAGKTVIVSQRFPAWLLARKPTERVKVAMYNVSHATKHTRQIRALMEDPAYIKQFPDAGLRLPAITSAEAFSTAARLAMNDAQQSVQALGLATGLVGAGPTTTVIDDPYSDPSEARSDTINDSVWAFWTDSLQPRLSVEANVIVMFHRYTENDLAGRLLATGHWELYRYAAVADGDYQCPVSKRVYSDPMGRSVGEVLSPRFGPDYIEAKKANSQVWLSQFQGRPTAQEGELFKVDNIATVQSAPRVLRRCRAWDLASSTKTEGDYTAGVLMGFDERNDVFILDVERGKWAPDEVKERIKSCAARDARHTMIRLPRDPGQAGVDQGLAMSRMLVGYAHSIKPVSGDKQSRAFEFSAAVNQGRVKMVAGPWNEAYIEELRTFPKGSNDDQCFPAGTLITTRRGFVDIQDVTTRDEVLTRDGFKRVEMAGQTGTANTLTTIHLHDGSTLQGTNEHPVFVIGKGFIPLDSATDGDMVMVCKKFTLKPSCSTESNIGDTQNRSIGTTECIFRRTSTGRKLRRCFTGMFGLREMAKFQTDSTFITKTEIHSTTPLKTLSALMSKRTVEFMQIEAIRQLQRCWRTLRELGHSPPLGTALRQDSNGIKNTPKNADFYSANNMIERAKNVAQHSNLHTEKPRQYVLEDAGPEQTEKTPNDSRSESVLDAAATFPPSRTVEFDIVAEPVRCVTCTKSVGVPVFNLRVADCHEYFANGILVHNCDGSSDAFNELATGAGIATDEGLKVEAYVSGSWRAEE